jgi:outer membrane protein assembly factor BamB
LVLLKSKLPLLICVVCSIAALVGARPGSVGPEQAAFSWRFATGGQIRSRPAVAPDGTIYAIAEDSCLYALSPSGQLAWKCDLGWLPWDCLAVGADGMIYAGLKNRDLVAVNPRGGVVWRLRCDGLFVGDPLIAPDGTVYVGIAPGTVVSLSESGRQQWRITLPGSLLGAPVMDGAGTIYLIASDRRLYALTQWGEFKWSLPLSAMPAAPAIAEDGTVLVGTTDGQVIAVSPDGDMLWHRNEDAPIVGISVGTDQIIAATADGVLLGLSRGGKELWKEDTRARLDSSPLLRGTSMLAFAQDGTLLMLNTPGGTVQRFSVGTPGAAVLAGDGSVYLGGRDWVLYALPRPAGAARITGSWPQAGHDEQHSGRTPAGPRGGLEAALNANPDYLYLQSLAGSGSHEQVLSFLSEVRSRVSQGSLGKSTFYAVRLLEQLAGTGTISPVYQNQKVINDFPDLRAEAASLLGMAGSAGSRWALIRVVGAENDSFALSAEIQALGALAIDGDGASARAISTAFSRSGTSPPDNRLAAATVGALDSIASCMGAMTPSAAETLLSIFHGAYFEDTRTAALAALQRERKPAQAQ